MVTEYFLLKRVSEYKSIRLKTNNLGNQAFKWWKSNKSKTFILTISNYKTVIFHCSALFPLKKKMLDYDTG